MGRPRETQAERVVVYPCDGINVGATIRQEDSRLHCASVTGIVQQCPVLGLELYRAGREEDG